MVTTPLHCGPEIHRSICSDGTAPQANRPDAREAGKAEVIDRESTRQPEGAAAEIQNARYEGH